jgi:hypothetical protein
VFSKFKLFPAGSLEEITKSIKSLQIKRLQAFLFSELPQKIQFSTNFGE